MEALRKIQAVKDILEERRWIYAEWTYPNDSDSFKQLVDTAYAVIMKIIYNDEGLVALHDYAKELHAPIFDAVCTTQAEEDWRNRYIDALYSALAEVLK